MQLRRRHIVLMLGVRVMINKLSMRKTCCLCGFLSLVFLELSLSGHAQDRWGIQGQYITLNGQPTFLNGANYIPSTGWLLILENWNPEAIERDIAALRKLGVTSLRFPPLWPLLQPTIDQVSKEKLARINQ